MGAVKFRWDLVPIMPTPGGRKSRDGTSELASGQSPAPPMLVCGIGKDLADKDVDMISSRPLHPPRPKNIRAIESMPPSTPRLHPRAEVSGSPFVKSSSPPNAVSSAPPGTRRLSSTQPGLNPLPLHRSNGTRSEAHVLPRPARAAVVCDGGLSADDCVDADRVPLSMNNSERGCYRLRKVCICALQNDGTLGLLLHGTSIVGFRCMHAEANGWKKGDQIVEINGRRAGNFDEFQECFRSAQREDGFPITFAVLRREETFNVDDNADDALANFFSTTDFTNLAGQLQKRWGEEMKNTGVVAADDNALSSPTKVVDKQLPTGASPPNYTMDNPYIVALQRRRDALFRTNEGWAKWADDDYVEATETVASQLAQKQDGVSMLNFKYEAPKEQEYCGLPDIFCTPNCAGNARAFELIDIEMAPTPRVHRYDALNSRDSSDPPWLLEVTSRTSQTCPEDLHERQEADFLETISVHENANPLELEDADANLLAHLLLASDEFRLPSDDEEEETIAPQNIAGALMAGDGSVNI